MYSCSFANELLSTPEYVIVHSHYVLLLLLLLNFLVHTSTLSVTHRPTHIHSLVLHYAHLKTVLHFIIYFSFIVVFSSIGLSVLLLQHNHRYAIGQNVNLCHVVCASICLHIASSVRSSYWYVLH